MPSSSDLVSTVSLQTAIIPYPLTLTPETLLTEAIAQFHKSCTCFIVVENHRPVGILTPADLMLLINQPNSGEKLRIRDIMTCPVITLPQSEFRNVSTTAEFLQQHQISYLPLVDEQGKLIGLVSDRSLQNTQQLIDLLELRRLEDVINSPVVSAPATASLLELAQQMNFERVSCVVLLEENNVDEEAVQVPVGLITQRDLLQFQMLGLDWNLPARRVMSTPIFSLKPPDSLLMGLNLMQQYRIEQIPIVGEEGELRGIVTLTQILDVIRSVERQQQVKLLEPKNDKLEVEKPELQQRVNPQPQQKIQPQILPFVTLQEHIKTDVNAVQLPEVALLRQVQRERLLYFTAVHIRQSLNLSEILNTATADVRFLLQCDRVLVYQLDSELDGRIVAESVGEGWTATLASTLKDPCLKNMKIQQYLHGYKTVINNIEEFNLTDCYQKFLAQFQVKAKLVVPLISKTQPLTPENQIWGLLIAHQCSAPRNWQDQELELLDEIAAQLSLAIQQSQLYQKATTELQERRKVETELRQLNQELEQRILERTAKLEREERKSRLFAEIALKIRQSLDLNQILQTTVEEVQKILQCDRLLIYRVFANGTGKAIAEGILPQWTSILNIDFPEEVFPQQYQHLYRQGEVKAIADVIQSYHEVTPCLCEFLDQFQVKSKLIVPIITPNHLWGFIIAHHCQSPRNWTEFEIELLREISDQVGIAVEQAALVKTIQEREQFIDNIANSNPNILYIFDLVESRFHYVSKASTDMIKYTPEELIEIGNQMIDTVIYPDDQIHLIEHLTNYILDLTAAEGSYVEYRVLNKQGECLWLASHDRVFKRNHQGKPTQIIGIAQNITDRKAAELAKQAALREVEFQKFALDQAAIVAITNAEGIITYANDNFCKISQYSREEVLGKTHKLLNSGYHDSSFFKEMWSTIQSGKVWKGEIKNQKKNKQFYWVDTTIVPFLNEQKEPFQYLAIRMDITPRKKAEFELFENNQILKAISEAQAQYIIDSNHNLLFDQLLSDILELTDSEYGFIGEVYYQDNGNPCLEQIYLKQKENPNIKTHIISKIAWNEVTQKLSEETLEKNIKFENMNTLFEAVVQTGQPVIANSHTDLQQGSLPDAHSPLNAFLGIPFYTHKELLGIVAVANRPGGYNQAILDYLQPFLATCSHLIEADRTERQRYAAEENLKRTLVAVEASIDGIAILRQDQYIYVNRSHLELFGYSSPEELLGKSWKLLYPDLEIERFEQEVIPHLSQYQYWQGEAIATRQDGSTFKEEVSLTMTEDGDLICVCRDISERKAAENQLQKTNEQLAIANMQLARASRLKDEFLANMSHELRTPLNSILGMSEVLQEETFGPLTEQQNQALRTIYRNGKHLLELINDILDLSKIEAGKLELECSPVSVNELCQHSLSFVKQQAYQKNIRLTYQIEDVSEALEVDERRMRQVLINLLNNAVKFTPEGGRVRLEVRGNRAEQHISFSVIDTGIGIAPEDQSKLFQVFMQVDSRLSRRYEGTGLGLALVKKLVEMHGGTVLVESEEGKGSCFIIRLPWTPFNWDESTDKTFSQMSQHITISSTSGTPRRRLLLAEDNSDNVRTLFNYLQAKGFDLEVAVNGAEAVEKAQIFKPQLIMMDIQMPEMDGLTAIRHIRSHEQTAHIPIIALTALTMPGDREKCLAAGANEYLAKPIQLRQLVQLLNSLIS